MSNIISTRSRVDNNINNMLDAFFGYIPTSKSTYSIKKVSTIPLANVIEKDSGYEINLAAPGLNREDFSLSVKNGILTVSSESQVANKTNGKFNEFNFNTFKRSWQLPEETNVESITANYKAGILEISIPTNNKKDKSYKINVQ